MSNYKIVLLCLSLLVCFSAVQAAEKSDAALNIEQNTTVWRTYPVSSDTYVRGGSYGDDNYSTETSITSKNSTSLDFARKILLQFDLSNVETNDTTINKVVIRLYSTSQKARPIAARMLGDDWQEATVTWNNMPDEGNIVSQTVVDADNQYFEWDITSFAIQQLAGDKVISLSMDDAEALKKTTSFASKEFGENIPQLVLYRGDIVKPEAPASLASWAVSKSAINLTWVDMSTDEEGFKIERKLGEEAFVEVASLEYGVTTYEDKGLITDTVYTYRISAFNTAGQSDYSNETTARTLDGIIHDNESGNIINSADYTYWRELAETSSMFASMKESAISTAINGSETRDVMGGSALAYILDPDNRATYIDKIKDKFDTRITDMEIGTGAASSSVRSHELWFALLALDVIRYDLDTATLSIYEGLLETKIMQLVIGQWDPHGWAMRMLWYKYAGDEANFYAAKLEWEKGLSEHYMANDGVSPAGNGYCMQRWTSWERTTKNTTTDIMEYMGYNEYYTNPGFKGLHEWLFGYSVSPGGETLLYGDSRDAEVQAEWSLEGNTVVTPTFIKSIRFSPEAYKYAMWVLRESLGKSDLEVKGYLSNYLIMAGTAADNNPIEFDTDDGELAPSRLFENHATLITNEQSTDALYLSMLNLTGNTEYHTHYETNAIALAGYGEVLTRNSGYDGPGNDVTVDGITSTAEFMHSDSEAANVLMVGGRKHTTQTGEGITEGIVGEDIEYFRGSSSTAIAGTHLRDVMFMQPSNGVNGYYLVMDHVSTDNTDDNVNVIWHPNSGTLNIIEHETEYFSEIKKDEGADGPKLMTENEATLTTFLGTAPASVEIKKMAYQSRAGYAYAGDYIYSNYNTVNNKADILTVLFPGDKTHAAGDITRIEAGAYSGAKIIQGDVQDIAVTSDGSSAASYESLDFKGENVVSRRSTDKFVSYFVKGMSFDDSGYGFQTENTVALYMKASDSADGMSGKITSKGATVTFYCPGIQSVQLDGADVTTIDSGSGWVQVEVPAGTLDVDILVDPSSLDQVASSVKSLITELDYSSSTSVLTVSCASLSSYQVNLIDMLGNVVSIFQSNGSQNAHFLGELSSGVYIVQVRSDNLSEERKLLVY